MRRANDWSHHVGLLSDQNCDPQWDSAVYARQWANDARCVRNGPNHRRVGEVQQRNAEWWQAGYAARQSHKKHG
jgi:hypothetical protein